MTEKEKRKAENMEVFKEHEKRKKTIKKKRQFPDLRRAEPSQDKQRTQQKRQVPDLRRAESSQDKKKDIRNDKIQIIHK